MSNKINKAFTDGICKVYSIEKRNIKDHLGSFNFCKETVGVKAFTEFQALGIEIEKVISIPYNTLVDNGRVVKLNDDDVYYQISLIQEKDTLPKSLKLTLSRTPLKWGDNND